MVRSAQDKWSIESNETNENINNNNNNNNKTLSSRPKKQNAAIEIQSESAIFLSVALYQA